MQKTGHTIIFGTYLHGLRKAKGLSGMRVQALSRELFDAPRRRLTQAYLSRLESGICYHIQAEKIVTLGRIYDVDPVEIARQAPAEYGEHLADEVATLLRLQPGPEGDLGLDLDLWQEKIVVAAFTNSLTARVCYLLRRHKAAGILDDKAEPLMNEFGRLVGYEVDSDPELWQMRKERFLAAPDKFGRRWNELAELSMDGDALVYVLWDKIAEADREVLSTLEGGMINLQTGYLLPALASLSAKEINAYKRGPAGGDRDYIDLLFAVEPLMALMAEPERLAELSESELLQKLIPEALIRDVFALHLKRLANDKDAIQLHPLMGKRGYDLQFRRSVRKTFFQIFPEPYFASAVRNFFREFYRRYRSFSAAVRAKWFEERIAKHAAEKAAAEEAAAKKQAAQKPVAKGRPAQKPPAQKRVAEKPVAKKPPKRKKKRPAKSLPPRAKAPDVPGISKKSDPATEYLKSLAQEGKPSRRGKSA